MDAPQQSKRWPFFVAVLGAAVVAVGGYFALRPEPPPPAPPQQAAAQPPPPADAPLPAAEESDAKIRRLAAGISPAIAPWLKESGLLERWAAVTDNLAEDVSPRKQLGFLAPAGRFVVQQKGGKTYIDPKSYQRYDAFADAVASVDAKAFAAAVRELHPLLESAYHALGYPGRSFDVAASQALQRLVNNGPPDNNNPVEVVPGKGAIWLFADEKLEKMGEVEKHLYRMGQRNSHLISGKAREVATELGLPVPARASVK
jgi:hypothetical protein